MTLKNPNMPAECDDRTKQDFETLMADQFSGDVYLVQKNHYGSDVSLYKFTPTRDSETIMLREVGKISSSPTIQSGGYGNKGCHVSKKELKIRILGRNLKKFLNPFCFASTLVLKNSLP